MHVACVVNDATSATGRRGRGDDGVRRGLIFIEEYEMDCDEMKATN